MAGEEGRPGEGGVRERIVAAALELLAEGGTDAVSTRAVSAAAGAQAPTIYRLFGDKQGLLDAAAVRGFRDHLAGKSAREPSGDPVRDLRDGWDAHVEFGLARPALYRLMYERARSGVTTPAATTASAILARYVEAVARVGRLRVPPERAVTLLRAAGRGTVLTLIDAPEQDRDPTLSPTAREAVIAAITTDATTTDATTTDDPAAGGTGPVPAAITLGAALPDLEVLTAPERALLGEWLERIAAGPGPA